MSQYWVKMFAGSNFPENACFAGYDIDGSKMYIGRAFHEGDEIPAKVIPSKQIAYVSYNGYEIPKAEFQVLTGFNFQWIPSSNGRVPLNALVAGKTITGESLYVGRTNYRECLIPGKVHGSHNCFYFPFGGFEHRSTEYEVLIGGPQKSQWILSNAELPCPMGAHVAGHDVDNSPIYIGRTLHEDNQLIAKVMFSKRIGYVAHNGKEIPKYDFEILCDGNVEWKHSSGGYIPRNAVPGGKTNNGCILYIGRAYHMGSLTIGNVNPNQNTLYIPFNGFEVSIQKYEILIEN